MGHYQEFALQRNDWRKIVPAARSPSTSLLGIIPQLEENSDHRLLVTCPRCSSASFTAEAAAFSNIQSLGKFHLKLSSFIRSVINVINIPMCKVLTLSSHYSSSQLIHFTGSGISCGRRVTGTLYGNRQGHVSFSVQHDSRSDPVLLLELGMSTSTLVKEMASDLVRIAMECKKRPAAGKLFQEPMWTMYCGGRKCGYALSRRTCTSSDLRVLNTLSKVSIGAGVIPAFKNGGEGSDLGELLYMRARFERVVGSRDSEAFYMLNPDKKGGPELSIFMLRI